MTEKLEFDGVVLLSGDNGVFPARVSTGSRGDLLRQAGVNGVYDAGDGVRVPVVKVRYLDESVGERAIGRIEEEMMRGQD